MFNAQNLKMSLILSNGKIERKLNRVKKLKKVL